MSDNYTELVKKLRNRRVCVQSGGSLDVDFPLMREAADAIDDLQASVRGYEMNTDMAFVKEDGRTVIRFIPKVQCPHYRPNHHDRGDDSLCEKYRCEVKALQTSKQWGEDNG